jgi:hypothetical protein
MPHSKNRLKIDEIASRFSQLLAEAGTSLENPTLEPTWRAFSAFAREAVQCDDERLFFEADLSTTQADSFYVHFARTLYGREPGGHVWAHEVVCDFLFPLDDVLDEFNCSIEEDDLAPSSPEREEFFQKVERREALWEALRERTATQAEIYIGEG